MKKLTTDEMNRLSLDEYREAEKVPLVVVLDNVRSQNNIGSVFRTSDAFRIERIVLCGICSTPPHREIHKTALGAEDSVEWQYYEQTEQAVEQLRILGYKVYAIEQVDDSLKLDDTTLLQLLQDGAPQGVAIIFGNEVDGVQPQLLPMCDGSIEIPQYGTKHSLNVSCAAAIVLWQISNVMRKK